MAREGAERERDPAERGQIRVAFRLCLLGVLVFVIGAFLNGFGGERFYENLGIAFMGFGVGCIIATVVMAGTAGLLPPSETR